MFTKQHYIEVARILRETEMPQSTRSNLTEEFVRVFFRDNSRFDRSRFDAAVQGTKVPKRRSGSIFDNL